MDSRETLARNVLRFNGWLSKEALDLPEGYDILNPFSGPHREEVRKLARTFYERYYDDRGPRRLILGSSPARRGTAVTGVPFEDADSLKEETGVSIGDYSVNGGSSVFLNEVIKRYGGREEFYSDFLMGFVFPLGITRTGKKGRPVNCNYYESRELREQLRGFVVESLKRLARFGIDETVCYCIGSGENFRHLTAVNKEHRLFRTIVPLEHPRFIMQYNAGRKNEYMEKYLAVLSGPKESR